MEFPNEPHQCPKCQSHRTNQVAKYLYYCISCGIEFDYRTNKQYIIMVDGELIEMGSGVEAI